MEYYNLSIIDGKMIYNVKKRKIADTDQQTTSEHVIARNEDIPYLITVKEEEVRQMFTAQEPANENLEGVEPKLVKYEEETTCPNCSLEFESFDDLESHRNAYHLSYRCDFCFKHLKTRGGLDRHIKSHYKPKTIFDCDICHVKMSRRTEFKQHLQEHNIGTQYVCELCPYVCTTMSLLHDHHIRVHVKKFTPLRFYPCDKCMLSFRSQDVYEEHQLYHSRMEQIE